jgi:transcriptional regulator with XRE-family HTH domain
MSVKKDMLKKDIGNRFRLFRETIKKTQAQLAEELDIYQSTITNIECGKTFPRIWYLKLFNRKYSLNSNWLITGQENMILRKDQKFPQSITALECYIKEEDPTYEKYIDLLNYMEVPEVEYVILARLTELKSLFREEIKSFFEHKHEVH